PTRRSSELTYDRDQLKCRIKEALRNRSKQERRKAYLAADANDQTALLVAVAEAERAENREEKKKEISALRLFIYENMDAFRDYRDILNKEQRVDTTGMRPMGAPESNMILFSTRLKKIGCSWSLEGLKRMLNALIHHFEGTLVKAIGNPLSEDRVADKKSKEYPSF